MEVEERVLMWWCGGGCGWLGRDGKLFKKAEMESEVARESYSSLAPLEDCKLSEPMGQRYGRAGEEDFFLLAY